MADLARKSRQALTMAANEWQDDCELQYVLAELLPSERKAFLDRAEAKGEIVDVQGMARRGLVELASAALVRGLVDEEQARDALFTAASYDQLAFAKVISDAFDFTKEETIEEAETTYSEAGEVEEEYEIDSVPGHAAKEGYLEMTQWALERFGYDRDDVLRTDIYTNALRGGNVELLEWLEETYDLTRGDLMSPYLLRDAVVANPATGMWFLDHFKPTLHEVTDAEIPKLAARVQRADILRWLLDNVPLEREGVLEYLFGGACAAGDLALAKDIVRRHRVTYAELASADVSARRLAYDNHRVDVLAWIDSVLARPIYSQECYPK